MTPKQGTCTLYPKPRPYRKSVRSVSGAILRTIDLYDLYDLNSSCESSDGSSDLFLVTANVSDDLQKGISDSDYTDASVFPDATGPNVAFQVWCHSQYRNGAVLADSTQAVLL